MQTHKFDTVIVGGGGAGLYAAITASEAGHKVAVVSKLYPQRSHTGAAQGGVSAALGNLDEDKPIWHAYDTVKGGDYLTDQNAARVLADDAPEVIIDLENRGLPFTRTPDGKIAQRRFGGHTKNFGKEAVLRACFAADRIGQMILTTLYQQAVKNKIEFFNEYQVIHLMKKGENKINGVAALELETGELHFFQAKAVMLATGGSAQIFKTCSNALTNTGDGQALVAKAGIPLEDMEFFQFHPTGIKGIGVLITEGVRGEGGILRNRNNEPFMEKYAPTLKDLAPRDMVSRAIMTEIFEGRGMKGDKSIDDYVMLDATHLGEEIIKSRLPDIEDFCKTYLGINPAEEMIPIQPTAHYTMGGIPTNIDTQVSYEGQIVEGLYAAGECACVSVHGANRLGSNSLLELVVFGRRAGKQMMKDEANIKETELDAIEVAKVKFYLEDLKARKGDIPVSTIISEMKTIMMEKVGVYREGKGLQEAIKVLHQIRKKAENVGIGDHTDRYNYDLLRAIEMDNMLDLAVIITEGALYREESRGAHTRIDFPDRNDERFLHHTLSYWDDENATVKVGTEPVDLSLMDEDAEHFKPKPRVY